MRIIAGMARGRVLCAPKGTDTRPTLDRVRESLFSILLPCLPGARVLDLFAGSGALGLEAISRGAASAVFADHARAAAEAVFANIRTLRAEEKTRLLAMDWRRALTCLRREAETFDLIFLDPPYRAPDREALLPAIADFGILAREGLVIFEHSLDWRANAPGWRAVDARRYGDTAITFFRREGTHAYGAVPGEL